VRYRQASWQGTNLGQRSQLPRAVQAGTALWGSFLGVGFLALAIHNTTPGPAERVGDRWPEGTWLCPAPDRPTLVMSVHPRCPCTRASAWELAQVLSRCRGRVEVYVLVFMPEQQDGSWGPGDYLRLLATMPGVHLVNDPGGALAARFGTVTSGSVELFAPDGRLLFHGGITSSRGHQGNNRGRQALLGLILAGSTPCPKETPVYGCPIVEGHVVSSKEVASWNQ
jgi:hypothetical protein